MSLSAPALIGRAVRWHGIRVGEVADVLLDRAASRAVGLEVRCEDGRERFLPLGACVPEGPSVRLLEPLAVSEPELLGFYRGHGLSLAVLLRQRKLRDVLLDPEGGIVSVVVPR